MTWKNRPTVEAKRTIDCVGRNPQALSRPYYDVIFRQLASDPDLRIRYAIIGDSDFAASAKRFADESGLELVSWADVKDHPSDLIVTASPCPEMYEPGVPVGLLPHGAGHGRMAPYRGGAGGTSRDQIRAEDGRLPAFMQIPGRDAMEQLAIDAPEALSIAHLNGDVCYERLLASLPWSADYRHALGVEDDQTLVVVTSSWDEESLLAERYDLLERLFSELPANEFRMAYIPHPNIDNHPHAPDMEQIWAFLRRKGLIMVPQSEGWRALLLAADVVIGDHGSVTVYAGALGKPVLLGAFGSAQMRPESALAAFGEAAPRFDHGAVDPAPQIRAAKPVGFDFSPILAIPDEGGPLDRFCSLVYRAVELEPPARPFKAERLPLPEPLPDVNLTVYRCYPDLGGDSATWPRFVGLGNPSDPLAPSEPASGGHLVVDMAATDPDEVAAARVLIHDGSEWGLPSRSEAGRRITECLRDNPLARIVSVRVAPEEAFIGIRDGPRCFVGGEWAQLRLLPSGLFVRLARHTGQTLGFDLVAEALEDLRGCFKTPLTLRSAEGYA